MDIATRETARHQNRQRAADRHQPPRRGPAHPGQDLRPAAAAPPGPVPPWAGPAGVAGAGQISSGSLGRNPIRFVTGKLTRNLIGGGKVAIVESRQSRRVAKVAIVGKVESRKSLSRFPRSRPQSLRDTAAEVLRESQSRPSESWESTQPPACPYNPCCSSSKRYLRPG